MQTLLIAATIAATAAGPALGQVRFHGEAGGAAVKVMSWRDIPFRTVVRQERDYSCGSAALATLLTHHYGLPLSEHDAFDAMFAKGDQEKIRRVGFSMLDMKRYLETRGMKADGFRLSLDDLARQGQPVIALIDLGAYRHFVVVKGVNGDKVLVGDPALGLHTFSRAGFQKMWNGIAFGLYPSPDRKPSFNRVSEWTPWATAPLDDVRGADGIGAMAAYQPTLYQITPIRDLSAMTAGVVR